MLILASASPRRSELLRKAGYRFKVAVADVPEVNPGHLTPGETVLLHAKRKADAVAIRHPRSPIVAADTLVAFEGKLLGKPRNQAEARRMLSMLSGKEHEVVTGVWIRPASGAPRGFIERSRVTFRSLTQREIARYLLTVETLDKAGSYAAQDDPMQIIARIEGSRSNVIGLPMERLREALRAL